MKVLEMAGLKVRVAGGTDREGGGSGPLVVLLHGFGAPGDDLTPFWRVLEAPAGTRWAFPAAPILLSPPDEPGRPVRTLQEARAWWMIDIERRLRAAERGELDRMASEKPAGLDEANDQVASLLDELHAALQPSKVVLGGFSQGAMLACDVALRTTSALDGIAMLSGTLVNSAEWAEAASRRRGLRAFQSHGELDPLLPFAFAEKLRDLLRRSGVDVTWAPFRGGHEIPTLVLRELGRWLLGVL